MKCIKNKSNIFLKNIFSIYNHVNWILSSNFKWFWVIHKKSKYKNHINYITRMTYVTYMTYVIYMTYVTYQTYLTSVNYVTYKNYISCVRYKNTHFIKS